MLFSLFPRLLKSPDAFPLLDVAVSKLYYGWHTKEQRGPTLKFMFKLDETYMQEVQTYSKS